MTMASEVQNFHGIEAISQDRNNSPEQNNSMMQNSAAMRPQSPISTENVESDVLISTESSSSAHNSPEPSLTLTNGIANIAITESTGPNPTHPPSEHIPDTINERPSSRASPEEPSSSFVESNDEDPPSATTADTKTDAEKKFVCSTTPTTATSTTTARSEPDSSGSHTCEKVQEEKDCETRDHHQPTDDEDGSCMTITAIDPASDPSEDTECQSADEDFQKKCELCHQVFPINEIFSMLKCTHTCCLECAKEYFTEQITNHTVTDCNCPYCKEPNLNGPNVTEDDELEYFANIDIVLRSIVDETVHDLFQRKLRDRSLTQDPDFKWCGQCSSGFFALPKLRELTCPDCGSITCASCRKPWESQHEGLSCEQYAEWKEANDPKLQAAGVQRYLQANGISCPRCQFRFELVRGGCIHFTCTQCKFEFCYGCNKPFETGAHCRASTFCASLGLHAHHPRNCLFYLRDKEPWELQNLLKMKNVPFDTKPTETTFNRNCPIPLLDTVCGAEVPTMHAGLCRTHYIEYLVDKVWKAQIDPLPIMDLNDCIQELRRRGIPVPERGPYDNDQIYREKCQQVIKCHIPLNIQ